MNIEATKLELMHLLLQTQKVSILESVKKIFEKETDWWDEMTEAEQKEVETGLRQLDKGEYIEHEKAMERFDKWK